jgi:hypothetical protein
MKHTLKEIVKGTDANMVHICEGKVYYEIDIDNSTYLLEINSMDRDWKGTYITSKFKTIHLMRWIRKGIEENDGTFIQIR